MKLLNKDLIPHTRSLKKEPLRNSTRSLQRRLIYYTAAHSHTEIVNPVKFTPFRLLRPIYIAYCFWFGTSRIGTGTKTRGRRHLLHFQFFSRVKMQFGMVVFYLVPFFAQCMILKFETHAFYFFHVRYEGNCFIFSEKSKKGRKLRSKY